MKRVSGWELFSKLGGDVSGDRLSVGGFRAVVICQIGCWYFCKTESNLACLIGPTEVEFQEFRRLYEGMSFYRDSNLSMLNGEHESKVGALVILSSSSQWTKQFCYFAADLAQEIVRIDRKAKDKVNSLILEWTSFFKPRPAPSREAVLGLMGELTLLEMFESVDDGVKYWVGPEGNRSDFILPTAFIEVKSSTIELTHSFSMQQLSAVDASAHFVVSFWFESNPGSISVYDVADRISSVCSDGSAFTKKLLKLGFDVFNPSSEIERFSLVEHPLVFEASTVPRVREVDFGVSNVRFTAKLDRSFGKKDVRALLCKGLST